MADTGRVFGGHRSIFFKLFLIYVVTTVALVAAVGGYGRMVLRNDDLRQTRTRLLAHSLRAIIEELGQPPDRSRAVQLAQETGMQVRVEEPGSSWATDDRLPDSAALKDAHVHNDLGMVMGHDRGRRFVILEQGERRFLFFFGDKSRFEAEHLAVIIVLIGLILGTSYVVVRRLFRPLDWLGHGVEEIAAGNLAHQVPVRSRDELGRLTVALNDMVTRIRAMLQARDRLLLDVSHELRTPLTRMKVALEFIKDEPGRNTIQQEVRELEAMVTELLESERLNSGYGGLQKQETDLVAVIRTLADVYRTQKPGIRIDAPASLTFALDQHRATMAIRNVVENALKHTAPDGEPVEIRIEKTSHIVRVSVHDHGPGIPREEQGLIFEPFYRVDKSRTRATGGYGLGLSLAKKIMIAHGGDILVDSQPGLGTTFSLIFPPCDPLAVR
ncbi:hypothetical protein YTPLAS18_31500 [Nitrospira sp.]|nr:hypothetical protein YTPLAS18_31500 [Nitrospira sp.]